MFTWLQTLFLIYGGETGWIGQKLVCYLREHAKYVKIGSARLENRNEIREELESLNPKFVVNTAGLTGKPNVDWCEEHKTDVLRWEKY